MENSQRRKVVISLKMMSKENGTILVCDESEMSELGDIHGRFLGKGFNDVVNDFRKGIA